MNQTGIAVSTLRAQCQRLSVILAVAMLCAFGFTSILPEAHAFAKPGARKKAEKRPRKKRKSDKENRIAAFERHVFKEGKGAKIPYRLLKPDSDDSDEKFPLVVYFHEGGAVGKDNEQHLQFILPIAREGLRRKFPCFVVAPQCPGLGMLNSDDWKKPDYVMTEKPKPILARYFELIDALVKKYPIDKDRIYVTGYSMGAYATLECIIRRPDFFAAALPVAGDTDISKIEKVKDLPIWVFYGDKDKLVPIAKANRLIEKLEPINPNLKTTIFKGEEHYIAPLVYKDADVWKWLFSQSRLEHDEDSDSE